MSVERKSLFLRGVPAALIREAKAESARRGQPLAAIVSEALVRSLRAGSYVIPAAANSQAITAREGGTSHELEDSMHWYREKRAELTRKYRCEYIAILEREVVDHDVDFAALASRVFRDHGTRSIYMPQVQERAAEVHVRSPRRVRS
ncbi:MAG TPA: hypothetical protein VL326_22910 [Kofleriaceae bacterium]|nr:hypothetical protein [Kofleriaceae bacterium]